MEVNKDGPQMNECTFKVIRIFQKFRLYFKGSPILFNQHFNDISSIDDNIVCILQKYNYIELYM